MKRLVILVSVMGLFLGGLVGCSELQIEKAGKVIIEVEKNARMALVLGCEHIPTVLVAIEVVQKFIPEGTTATKIEVAVTKGEVIANDICTKVMVAQAQSPNKVMIVK